MESVRAITGPVAQLASHERLRILIAKIRSMRGSALLSMRTSHPMGISWSHILIALMIFVLLFGSGKISGLMGDVAKGIKSLKKGLAEETEYEGKPELQSIVFRDNNPALKSVRQKLVQKSRTGF